MGATSLVKVGAAGVCAAAAAGRAAGPIRPGARTAWNRIRPCALGRILLGVASLSAVRPAVATPIVDEGLRNPGTGILPLIHPHGYASTPRGRRLQSCRPGSQLGGEGGVRHVTAPSRRRTAVAAEPGRAA